MEIKNQADLAEIGGFLAGIILEKLKQGQKVFWLVPGGSGMKAAAAASGLLSTHPHGNLVVSLTDERFGPVGHKDSNWQQLKEMGFGLPEAKLIPVLHRNTAEEEIQNFGDALKEEMAKADFKLGFFGIGSDGHTAGILPGSPAATSDEYAAGYQAENYYRITMTPKAIAGLDMAAAYAVGENKRKVLSQLVKEDRNPESQPAQFLKQVPKFILFTDFKG